MGLMCSAKVYLTVLVLSITSSFLVRPVLSAQNSHRHRLNALYQQYDPLVVARCEAKCWHLQTHRNQCVKQCLLTGDTKPGDCPGQNSNLLTPFEQVCMETCRQDTQCPSTSKCCRHQCGVTCQAALGLEKIAGLPRIPTTISVAEKRKGRTLRVRWTAPESATVTGPILYVLEERHLAGSVFVEQMLGPWTPKHRTNKTSIKIRNLVKPGRWYQFRIAAVNTLGSRGYSEASKEFITSLGPRPPEEPTNMTVGPLRIHNGTLRCVLQWEPPKSDLPIQKYKVFWSRRLHGKTALDSVLVKQVIVSKDVTRYELQNLEPNSQYFLQVQAVAHFGNERLKGEKAALVLNTTNHTNYEKFSVTDSFKSSSTSRITEKQKKRWDKEAKRSGNIEGLHVQRPYWSRNELMARVTWKMKKPCSKYIVTWWAGPCKNGNNSTHLQMAVTTKAPYFHIYKLDYTCQYQTTVTCEAHGVFYEASTSFQTPSCHEVHKDKTHCTVRHHH